ncbi:MAG: N-6 DNA methylase [Polaromonas sp.]|uniref:HsdM family class I SAM-dependent methyltransferase n=1 Tax=Polaromonas sp. TaxID=1869339 RepID=UPI0025DB9AC6|nr:N-6 DNA methylase [Polaromonas sp.]MBI2726922.1 N-6 DNA methylase [Polaromonas sp.]
MPNERTTESIVRDHLIKFGVKGQVLEEQTSDNARVRRALMRASKSGDGAGKPEFILRLPEHPDVLIVIECKANASKHESADRTHPQHYAVDGVLLYASELAKEFDVIAIAVSGTSVASLKVSTFRWLNKAQSVEELVGPHGPIKQLVRVTDLIKALTFDPAVRARSFLEVMDFSRELHNFMRDHAKVSEAEKPLVVSGILLALRDEAFLASWRKLKTKTLGREMLAAIKREAEAAFLDVDKQRVMLQPYSFLETHPALNREKDGDWPLRTLVNDIEANVWPFISTYEDIDVLGRFYGEFLRYAGGDKKGLGIVLTPHHITELFTAIAAVSPNDTVVDTCCGTGGFLIAAMTAMDKIAGNDEKVRRDIREHRLVGVEDQPHMFALAVSNMILRGDGKANLYRSSSFDPLTSEKLITPSKRHARPTVGLINPPFSQKGAGLHELDFVAHLLDVLAPGGRAVVVLPMSCAIESHPAKELILAKHTLVAAMSLPNDLFAPVGVVTIALVFEAHRPHASSPKKTWLAMWKDDGFVKMKHKGRVDSLGRWEDMRSRWLDSYHSQKVQKGVSLSRKVGAEDEWCAEAYLTTNYSSLSVGDVEKALRSYAVFAHLHRMEHLPEGVDADV